MGVLLFAFRKLMLKRRINDKNYRLTLISQKQQSVTDQIGQLQQMISGQKNYTQIQSTQGAYQQQMAAYQQYNTIANNTTLSDEQKNQQIAGIQQNMMAYQNATAMYSQMQSSIFDGYSKCQMAPLNAMDNQLTLERETIESELKQLNAEYESVEKAESQEAKQSAPKFGLG